MSQPLQPPQEQPATPPQTPQKRVKLEEAGAGDLLMSQPLQPPQEQPATPPQTPQKRVKLEQGVVLMRTLPKPSVKLEDLPGRVSALSGVRRQGARVGVTAGMGSPSAFSILHSKISGRGIGVSSRPVVKREVQAAATNTQPKKRESAGVAACLASSLKRKHSIENIEGKMTTDEAKTSASSSGRSLRPRRGSTRTRSQAPSERVEHLILRLMKSRGRECVPIFLPQSDLARKHTDADIEAFDMRMAMAATEGPIEDLEALLKAGRSPNACSRFGETLLHKLSRRGDTHVDKIKLLIKYGASVFICDDFGRTPLHDAFWCSEPAIEVVTVLLLAEGSRGAQLLMAIDGRGGLPTSYARVAHQDQWKKYFNAKASMIWPKRTKTT